jgi:hypothetical protein
MKMHLVDDGLSKTLVTSIPRKILFWLQNLNQDISQPQLYGDLRTDFDVGRGSVELVDGLLISWTGDISEMHRMPSSLWVSDQDFTNVGSVLSKFVDVEHNFYSNLEKFEKALELKINEV